MPRFAPEGICLTNFLFFDAPCFFAARPMQMKDRAFIFPNQFKQGARRYHRTSEDHKVAIFCRLPQSFPPVTNVSVDLTQSGIDAVEAVVP
jgi:hypothetical protein